MTADGVTNVMSAVTVYQVFAITETDVPSAQLYVPDAMNIVIIVMTISAEAVTIVKIVQRAADGVITVIIAEIV